ncbi:ASCH domain-containing protein [Candidatus Daviesbacteria bacterium]|nr:ASCH domain-containing protein [Candidatus Daviesbacteria bacterium]
MQKHLAIFKDLAGEEILSGRKTIECRFSKAKNPPFGVISSGDLVYIKPSGKEIIGQFRVKKVIFYDGVTKKDLDQLRSQYEKELIVKEDFWQKHQNAIYATIIFIGDCARFITPPIKPPKKDLRGWVVLT